MSGEFGQCGPIIRFKDYQLYLGGGDESGAGEAGSLTIDTGGSEAIVKIDGSRVITETDLTNGPTINTASGSTTKFLSEKGTWENAAGGTTINSTVPATCYITGANASSGSVSTQYVSTSIKINSSGQVTASSFNATSDARKKENIESYVPEKSILDLDVKRFDFIEGPKNQVGCIAQDLQQICPEIVHEDEEGYLSIQESKIVYLLLDEVKKLRKELDELKNK